MAEQMQASVSWLEDDCFVGLTPSGKRVVLDCAGAQASAPSPMEMVLVSLGSCSSVDVVSILKKARQQVTGCEVKITAQRADEAPRVFTAIHLHFIVSGENISSRHVERAVALSADKYCSVAKMLEGRVTISHSFDILAAEGG